MVSIITMMQLHASTTAFQSGVYMRLSRVVHAYRVVLFGSDDVSFATLNALRRCTAVKSVELVCQPHVPILKQIAPNDLVVHVVPGDLKSWRPPSADIAVVASFGKLIPAQVIESFPLGGLNMHPSLLPRCAHCFSESMF